MALKTRVLVLVIVVACLRYCVHCQPHFFPANQQDMLMRGQLFTALPGTGARRSGLSMSTLPRSGTSPFSQMLGSGLGSPSPLGLLDREDYFSSSGRQNPFSSGATGREENYASLTRNHPFSSIRLNPVPTSKGVSLSRPQSDRFERRRDRFPSLFDNEHSKKYSLDSPSTFEKPISKTSLPDVNSPITLDLANEQQERVAYAKQKGKLPPPRGVSDENADNDRPSLSAGFGRNSRLGKKLLAWDRPSSLPPMPGRRDTAAPTVTSFADRQPTSDTSQAEDATNLENDDTEKAPYFDDTAPFIENSPEVQGTTPVIAKSPESEVKEPTQDTSGTRKNIDGQNLRSDTPPDASVDTDNYRQASDDMKQDTQSNPEAQDHPTITPGYDVVNNDNNYTEPLPKSVDGSDGDFALSLSDKRDVYPVNPDNTFLPSSVADSDKGTKSESQSFYDADPSVNPGVESTTAETGAYGNAAIGNYEDFPSPLEAQGAGSPQHDVSEYQPSSSHLDGQSPAQGADLTRDQPQTGSSQADSVQPGSPSPTTDTTSTQPARGSEVEGQASGPDADLPGETALNFVTTSAPSVEESSEDNAVDYVPDSASAAVGSGLEQADDGNKAPSTDNPNIFPASTELPPLADRPATSGNPVNDGSTTTQYTDPDPASYPQRGPEPRTDDLFVYQPDHAGSPTNKEQRNPEIALNVAGAGSSRAPSSPFEMMFGRSLQEAYQQTFGSLFGNLNRGVSQPGAALSGGQVGFEGGSDGRARGAGFDNDVSSLGSFSNPYGSGKNLFDADVNGIVNKRPSLRLFGRK